MQNYEYINLYNLTHNSDNINNLIYKEKKLQ